MGKEKFVKTLKSPKMSYKWLSTKFSFPFLFFLTSKFGKKSHIYARILFIFLKNVLKQNWNSFNTKFILPGKDGKNSYKVKQNLRFFAT